MNQVSRREYLSPTPPYTAVKLADFQLVPILRFSVFVFKTSPRLHAVLRVGNVISSIFFPFHERAEVFAQ